jgi:hypothetical protein
MNAKAKAPFSALLRYHAVIRRVEGAHTVGITIDGEETRLELHLGRLLDHARHHIPIA